MAVEYNSRLISRLYASTNYSERAEVIDEMEEISDSIFLYPIFDAWNAQKKSAPRFIRAISTIGTKESLEILLKIMRDDECDVDEKTECLPGLAKHAYFEKDILEFAKMSMGLIADRKLDSFQRFDILSYLERAKSMASVEEELRKILGSEKFNKSEKEDILRSLVKIDPNRIFEEFIRDYEQIKKDETLENIVAKEVSAWNKGNADKLKETILRQGNTRAKEIIQKSIDAKKQEEEKKEKESVKQQEVIFGNAGLIDEIGNLRDRINLSCTSNTQFGFDIFLSDETLTKQMRSATDEASLMKACVDLRDTIKKLNEKINEHGLQEADIEKLLSTIPSADRGKPINLLFLFLHSRKLPIGLDVFGIRKFNQLVSLLGSHPQQRNGVIGILSEYKLEHLYSEQNWSKLHAQILEIYKTSLQRFLEALPKENFDEKKDEPM